MPISHAPNEQISGSGWDGNGTALIEVALFPSVSFVQLVLR